MSQERNNPDRPRGADDFEAWVNEHPTAHDDLEDLSRLRELYQSAGPSEPGENAWNAALNGICARVPAVRAWRRASPHWLRYALGATAAAAVLAVVLLGRSWWTTGQLPPVVDPEEPYPVVEAGDVTIISMDPHDVAALVVGEPPVTGELVFARPDDVRVIKCVRCPHSGNVPQLKRGEVPMFVASVVGAENPHDE
jgi:hypothetical protein